MRAILNSLDEYIIGIGFDNKIKFVSDNLLDTLDYTENELQILGIDKVIYKNQHININLKNHIGKFIEFCLNSKLNNKIYLNGKIICDKFDGEEIFFIICKKNQEQILKEIKVEDILETLPDGIWIKEHKGKYVYVNDKFCKNFNINKEDIIGKSYDYFGDKNNKKISKSNQSTLKLKRPLSSVNCSVKIIRKKWYRSHKYSILDKDKNVKFIMGICKENNIVRGIQDDLNKCINEISTISNIVNIKYNTQTIFNYLEEIECDILKKLNIDGLSILLYDENSNRLTKSIALGKSAYVLDGIDYIDLPIKDFKSEIEKHYNRTLKVDNSKILMFKDKLLEYGTKYIGIYKIMFDNEIVGIMNIGYRESTNLNCDEYHLINIMCSLLGIKVGYSNLTRKLREEFYRRKKAEEELESFLSTAVDLMTIVDINGKYQKVGVGWRNCLQWTEEEMLNSSMYDFIHPDDIQDTKLYLEEKKYNNSIKNIVNRYRCKDGNYRILNWSCEYNRERDLYIATAKDITEEKKLEEERKKYEEALYVENIKNEFFANMSHEFKTPLNIILSSTQLIESIMNKDEPINNNENFNRYIRPIKQNSNRLLRLINNVIDMTRIDTGYYDIHLENKNIVSIVEDIVTSVIEYVEGKHINLVFDTEIEELIVACDLDKIERIMLNLLSNAIKYTEKNGTIYINIVVENDIIISVKDNGIGIPKNKQYLIFERFRQVDNLLTRSSEGSGIGLSLAKSLVEMHSGKIWVESVEGQGSEFKFSIPLKILENSGKIKASNISVNSRVERCDIEFSDIYSL
ncbi:MAG: ATP-binding protein [Romboutsia sp.]